MSSIGQFGHTAAADAPLDLRLGFLRRTYAHIAGAVALFILLSTLVYSMGFGEAMIRAMGNSRGIGLLLIGGFVVLGWLSRALTQSEAGIGIQYAGFALYVVLETVIFAPILYVAATYDPTALTSAAIVSGLTFGGLTAYVLTTKKDFSFMGPVLFGGFMLALGAIICGALFGFELGIWFSVIMVGLAVGAILFSTSKALLTYRTDQHVAAATELFAALATLFYYVLRLFLQMRR